jgi:hypothetical protein
VFSSSIMEINLLCFSIFVQKEFEGRKVMVKGGVIEL